MSKLSVVIRFHRFQTALRSGSTKITLLGFSGMPIPESPKEEFRTYGG
ncbi:hypothetical protein JS578_14610 (plasmid) [Dysgonomonadaceae bacterium zrk40]|nr:hypothetical protein JS578_14610 [Dysgonomonadaceae bacterium zrk40]